MPKGKQITKTLQVKEKSKVVKSTLHANGDTVTKDFNTMKLVSHDGATIVTIRSPEQLDGFSEKDIIDIALTTSQTSLDDFSGEKEVE